jgi:hypothetical protein
MVRLDRTFVTERERRSTEHAGTIARFGPVEPVSAVRTGIACALPA